MNDLLPEDWKKLHRMLRIMADEMGGLNHSYRWGAQLTIKHMADEAERQARKAGAP